MAAMAERRLATCQPVKDVNLTAAPPVENSNAAARTIIRSTVRAGGCSFIGSHNTCRSNSYFKISTDPSGRLAEEKRSRGEKETMCYHLPDARSRIRNPPIRFPNGELFCMSSWG